VPAALVRVELAQVEQVEQVLEPGPAVLEPAVLVLAEPVARAVAEPVAVRLVVAAGIPRWTEPPPARLVHPEQVRCRRTDRLSRERSQLSAAVRIAPSSGERQCKMILKTRALSASHREG
jgi:hypothetical protein